MTVNSLLTDLPRGGALELEACKKKQSLATDELATMLKQKFKKLLVGGLVIVTDRSLT